MAPAAMNLLCTGLYLLSYFAQVSDAAPWLFSRSVPASYHDGRLGAVASENSMCSEYGADMLKMGGNAADAVCIDLPRSFLCFFTLSHFARGLRFAYLQLTVDWPSHIDGCDSVLRWCYL